ncbi:MAG: TROVE domain-containing protein, partial [Chthonomonadaceae bacterium]|nr:TROVE domain-containing protein [Chthonomonadaceae bacterium]
MRYLTKIKKGKTPQSEPIQGLSQVQNSAGGFVFSVSKWTQLSRFLILGSEGGSYYATEQTLTRENAKAVEACIKEDGERVVREIVAVSEAGRAAKNDPALFALAMCAGLGDEKTRRAALDALPKVARIGTHLFHFAAFVEGFRGWGRGLRKAVGNWYDAMPTDALALQAIKYGSRDGWGHRDLLRLSHPKTSDETCNALYHWMVDGWETVGESPHPDPALNMIWAHEKAMKASTGAEVAQLIREYRLPMEATPTDKRTREVWEA